MILLIKKLLPDKTMFAFFSRPEHEKKKGRMEGGKEGREASREERWDWDTAASEKREGGEC